MLRQTEPRLDAGPNNLRDVAIKARELYKNDWGVPNAPPALPIKVNYADKRVTLDWTWHPGDKTPNPLETWDDSNKFVNALPDTHWRRRSPPTGHTAGGRVFEGFKVWRSEFPDFKERQFTLLKQFDIDDDLHFNNDNGLQWTYTDTEVVRGRRYWYAVTSFTIPDYIVSTYQQEGQTISDTVVTEPIETGIHENAVSVPIPFEPATKVNQVKVVPNPYRTDRDYRFETGGWEGLTKNWDETKRVIWFIHLPARATIRVFSMAGELISTIYHDDADRTSRNLAIGQEEFELLSDSHRTLASGIYIFTVESDFGKQMGKFVVIR